MEIYLHKLLPVHFLPAGLLSLLMLAGLIWRSRVVIAVALAFFWLATMPVVSDTLMRVAENHAERIAAEDAPPTAPIVVLSEGRYVAPDKAAISKWSDGDRFWGGGRHARTRRTQPACDFGLPHAAFAAPVFGGRLATSRLTGLFQGQRWQAAGDFRVRADHRRFQENRTGLARTAGQGVLRGEVALVSPIAYFGYIIKTATSLGCGDRIRQG